MSANLFRISVLEPFTGTLHSYQIAKIRVGDGVDHFDADTSPHHHFVCKECGAVIDLTLPPLSSVDEAASAHFDGQIEGHTIYFYGKCKACCEAQANG